mmetsp:Transcript_21864/g.49729  ORF Transcript_21864/g.49729 Transcript_21864/m.49729 type:complete len:130 (-) Transcript_21864:360-749(-)
MAIFVVTTRTAGEGFASMWAAFMLVMLSGGGTMIMRKFHNSIAVGFFMGTVVATSQLFFLLFLVYSGYSGDRVNSSQSGQEESVMAMFCFIQAVLLGSFAAILGAHRSEILDRTQGGLNSINDGEEVLS